MPRVTYQYIKDINPADLSKMSKSQLADLLRKIRIKTQTRFEQIEKAKNIFSPAKQTFENNVKMPNVNKMSRNAMIHEILEHQHFHQAKTSTVQGAKKVATEQDIMIFGAGPSGRPKHRMKAEQRARFWAVYDEFLRTYKDAYARFRYQSIFQHLGEMHIKGKIKTRNEINVDDLEYLLNSLENAEEDLEEYDTDSPNVYSGRRSY